MWLLYSVHYWEKEKVRWGYVRLVKTLQPSVLVQFVCQNSFTCPIQRLVADVLDDIQELHSEQAKPVGGCPEWGSSTTTNFLPYLKHFKQLYQFFVCLLQLLMCFCNDFPKFGTKFYTVTLLSKICHHFHK